MFRVLLRFRGIGIVPVPLGLTFDFILTLLVLGLRVKGAFCFSDLYGMKSDELLRCICVFARAV